MKIAARVLTLSALLVGVLSACTAVPPSSGQPQPFLTATLSSLYMAAPTSSFSLGVQPPVTFMAETPNLTSQSPPDATQVPPGGIVDTGNPPSDLTATQVDPTSTPETSRSVMIYADKVNPDWQVLTNGGINFQLNNTAQVHTSKTSIEVTPVQPESKLVFALNSGAQTAYPRSQVLGFDFWLYSGAQGLDLYDLAVSAIGSNNYPYYLPGDRSGEAQKPYEDTYLVYLGFNQNIPPNMWVEVTIWLDKMLYDPSYKYVTGFYLKNRYNFERTFYVADVSMIVQDSLSSPTSGVPVDTTLTPGTATLPIRTETPSPALSVTPTSASQITGTVVPPNQTPPLPARLSGNP